MTDQRTYLEVKRTVDDRALNRRVLERFVEGLDARSSPVRIVEIGAGIGTMIARLAAWDCLPDEVAYRAVDRDAESVRYARERVPEWLEDAGYAVERLEDDRGGTTLLARSGGQRLEVTLEVADGFEIEDRADAVIASAVLDIVDLERAVPAIEALLEPDGLLYAPITFDGGTTFAPPDPADDRIERRYHHHMDAVRSAGGSRVGRELLWRLPDAGWSVLEAGGSDWVVRPRAEGARAGTETETEMEYPDGERSFLEGLLETIDGALAELETDERESGIGDLEPAERRRWLERRRNELESGELVFVAHNLDVLARPPE
ncbi:class I SAM-dependent methyltransferase [Natronococcus sp. A-GB7]|uniref:class I SAM-dependent methyltransferase n=1 Tax=Natronococcus sp. A-GB7 TaxID=3037649 RepID=UPI00241D991A|nr:class I SAM-dependent methyltransferase [Natronococcus sp. A-GB7]MDG5818921.1 class I SAM-dependent methyltransferase [Natronococcus sp. A-GB7]